LLGCTVRVTVGKKSVEDNAVDVRSRGDASDKRIPAGSVVNWVVTWMEEQ